MHTESGYKNLGNSNKCIKATISFILGILSIVFSVISLIGIVLGIIGFFYGVLALSEIKRTKQQGRDIAIAGMVCSFIGISLPIISIILFFNTKVVVN